MISKDKLEDFKNDLSVVGCFVHVDEQILILKRQDHDTFPNKWGLPAGGVLRKEDKTKGMKRELYEETGIEVNDSDLVYFDKVYIRENGRDMTFYMYNLYLRKKPHVILDPEEHKEYRWIKPENIEEVDYMVDLDFCIDMLIKS